MNVYVTNIIWWIYQDARGNDVDLSIYKGKGLLIVNVASQWYDTDWTVILGLFDYSFVPSFGLLDKASYSNFSLSDAVGLLIQTTQKWLNCMRNTRTKVISRPFSFLLINWYYYMENWNSHCAKLQAWRSWHFHATNLATKSQEVTKRSWSLLALASRLNTPFLTRYSFNHIQKLFLATCYTLWYAALGNFMHYISRTWDFSIFTIVLKL